MIGFAGIWSLSLSIRQIKHFDQTMELDEKLGSIKFV